MPELLNAATIEDHLARLPGWTYTDGALRKTWQRKGWLTTVTRLATASQWRISDVETVTRGNCYRRKCAPAASRNYGVDRFAARSGESTEPRRPHLARR